MTQAVVRPIPAIETLPIRQRILRPDQPIANSIYPTDEATATCHYGAFLDGRLVGVATVFPEASPRGEGGAWRLRGMATLAEVRGQGHGGRLLEACIQHVEKAGGLLLWCNAREVAIEFYRRHGFEITSERFELPLIGPHYVMQRVIKAG